MCTCGILGVVLLLLCGLTVYSHSATNTWCSAARTSREPHWEKTRFHFPATSDQWCLTMVNISCTLSLLHSLMSAAKRNTMNSTQQSKDNDSQQKQKRMLVWSQWSRGQLNFGKALLSPFLTARWLTGESSTTLHLDNWKGTTSRKVTRKPSCSRGTLCFQPTNFSYR